MIVDDEVGFIAAMANEGKNFMGPLRELANEAKRYQCLRSFTPSMFAEVHAFCFTEDMAFDSMIDRVRAEWPNGTWDETWGRITEQVIREIRDGHCVGHRGMGRTRKDAK